MTKVSIIKATKDIKLTIAKAIDEIGGIKKFIKPGDAVLIKPNYLTANPAPVSTPIDTLRAVTELVFEAGAKKVIIGESSNFTIKNQTVFTKKTLEEAGVFELEKLGNVEVMSFDDNEWVNREVPKGRYLKKVSVPKVLDEVDKIILLPVAKTHRITDFTGALKLAIGFMLPKERIKLHLGHISEKVAEMNTIFKPDLIIMDARKCFIAGGPGSGEVREPGLILASESRVDMDVEEIKIIQNFESNSLVGKEPEKLAQIKRARELKIDEA